MRCRYYPIAAVVYPVLARFEASIGLGRYLIFDQRRLTHCSKLLLFAIRESRIANKAMLKPQDIVVIGKILAKGAEHWSQGQIAHELKMSASEVNAAIKRAEKAGLLRKDTSQYRLVKSAVEEFLLHGFKYVFPTERGEPTRGIPTSAAAPPLREFFPGDEELPPVWPDPEGEVRGYSLRPLYSSVPIAVKNDPELYEFLALLDALRSGRAREVNLAKKELQHLLHAS